MRLPGAILPKLAFCACRALAHRGIPGPGNYGHLVLVHTPYLVQAAVLAVLTSANIVCFSLMPVLYKQRMAFFFFFFFPGVGAEQMLQQGFLQISLEVCYLQTIHPWP